MSETNCRFCNGQKIGPEYIGTGIRTMRMNLSFIIGTEDDPPFDGIRLCEGNKLAYDSSAGEYAEQMISISYCPFCGRKLLSTEP